MNVYLITLILLLNSGLSSAKSIVNVYVWGGEIPKKVIQQFEAESGIKVNFSTYDSNETMYAKLKASSKNVYDVILPSAYFVERMQKSGMLHRLNPKKLPNLKHLNPRFTHNDYDPSNQFSVPLIWGATGILYNNNTKHRAPSPTHWQHLWHKRWHGQLMLLDDSREIFAMALLSLGFNPNDNNPHHIRAAYQHLLKLIPNIKLFASDGIQAMIIDEDALSGSAWNGDVFKAKKENKRINFSYPKEGFVVWVDCLAMPKNPPHLQQAYQFINFMLQPDTAKKIAFYEGHAITNQTAQAQLPSKIRNNKMIYPSNKIMQRAHFQRDLSEETLALYNQYWQQLKEAF